MKKIILTMVGLVCAASEAQNFNYTAFVIGKNRAQEWQILLIKDTTPNSTMFSGFVGKATGPETTIENEAKKLITSTFPNNQPPFTGSDLTKVFYKEDAQKQVATIIFYSSVFIKGDENTTSWMKIDNLKKNNQVYYGPVVNKKRSLTGQCNAALYKLLFTAPTTWVDKALEKKAGEPWPTTDALLFYKQGQKPPTQARDYFEFTNTYEDKLNPIVVPDITGQDLKTNKYVQWPSSEHYFQSQKFDDPVDFFNNNIKSVDAGKLQGLMRKPPIKTLKVKNSNAWIGGDNIKAMLNVLRAKFSQDEALKKLLLETGDALLIEDSGQGSANDIIWGAGKGYVGFNYLGQLLMHVRQELKTGQALLFTKADGYKDYKSRGISTTPDLAAPQWYTKRLAALTGSSPSSSEPINLAIEQSLTELALALQALKK